MTDLIVHDDSVGSGVEQRGLGEQLSLLVLVLFAVGLLHIVSGQGVQGPHLVTLAVGVVQAGVRSRRLQDLDEVICKVLFVVLQLQQIVCRPSTQPISISSF